MKDYLYLGCLIRFYPSDGLHQWLLVAVIYLTLLETAPMKIVQVQTEYLDYYTRNIESFGQPRG